MRGFLIAVAVLVAGCDESPELRLHQVCDAVCTCSSPTPIGQAACFEECEVQLAGADFSDTCVECATGSACLAIDDCFDLCFPGVP